MSLHRDIKEWAKYQQQNLLRAATLPDILTDSLSEVQNPAGGIKTSVCGVVAPSRF